MSTKNVVAMVTINEDLVINSNVATILARDKKEQKIIASELGRCLMGSIFELHNGVIIVTQE